LSGGEQQRLKLTTHIAKPSHPLGVYVLDEPTAGPAPATTAAGFVFEGAPADLIAARSTLTAEHVAAYVGT
jgi:hypothetical protein